MKKLIILSIILAVAGLAYAAQRDAVHSIEIPVVKTELKAGEGRDTTERYCSICHSLDYIIMQPKFPKAKWAGVVNKMIKVMGAPIPEEDAKVIIDYLAVQYGTGD
jgi:cytochrome c5